ncbi:hypothetical protein [Moorena producens]|uniref:hypothetical protein n=1 Tax=Moorena producens TaxID=1155739 RepID=UPI0011EA6515|nr:hypothetical protein [Moorena producens]
MITVFNHHYRLMSDMPTHCHRHPDSNLSDSSLAGGQCLLRLWLADLILLMHCPPYIYSRFPIPDSRFPIPDSRFPITYSKSPTSIPSS